LNSKKHQQAMWENQLLSNSSSNYPISQALIEKGIVKTNTTYLYGDFLY
jgi:hypothetical protein